MIFTFTLSLTAPASVSHERVYVVSPVIGLVVCVPEAPLHESVKSGLFSETRQELTLVADQVIVDDVLKRTKFGFALIERSG
ncbi:MAG: hypothetical protein OQJ98_02915 [Candidatus Pacebacteria bacterium]|nr:hypothetical protein [Candidatus Paceibacterota bacterium]